MKHPARELGAWLKARRQRQGFVARVFAGQIELGPAEYAEAEAGVVRWIGQDQERLICQVLTLSPAERQEFLKLLTQARAAKRLESLIFSPASNWNRCGSGARGANE